MATKNLIEEFKSIEEIDRPSNNAQLDGIPVTVTKMQDPKRGKKRYFHAKISDGSKKMRLVGFNEDHQKQLASYETQKSPIRIKECYIQRSSYSGDLEIKLNDTSVIEKSPTKFKIPSPPPTDFTAVSTISSLCSSDRVDVKIKVLKTAEPIEVSTGKQKQDIVIVDKSAAIKLTLWEADIGMLEETQSYELRQMMVRTFNDVKLLNYPKEGGSFNAIPDIGDTATYDDTIFTPGAKDLDHVTIAGVSNLNKYHSCIKCSSKIKVDTPSKYARCTNASCRLFQSLSSTNESFAATLVLNHGDQHPQVRVFDKELKQIVDVNADGDITEIMLMEANPFSCTVSHNDTINKVWRTTE